MAGRCRRILRTRALGAAEAVLTPSDLPADCRLDVESTVDVRAGLGVIRRGGGDPTWHDDPDGTWWKAWNTPQGPVTLQMRGAPRRRRLRAGEQLTSIGVQEDLPLDERILSARMWGPGSQWLVDRLPRLIGAEDDDSGFVAHHALVAQARRRFPRWRVPCTGLVMESLVPAIIEQRVTGKEAFGAYRALVRRHGSLAPGPHGDRRLMVAPTPAQWARIPSWEWLQAGVDASRADVVMRAAQVAGRLEQCADLPLEQARRRLLAISGVGRWTLAEVAHVALGDADAVSFGDYHVAKDIGYALTGSEVNDDELAVLLEPYAGHRYRVQRLLELIGAHRPRRGARMTLPAHVPRPGNRWGSR